MHLRIISSHVAMPDDLLLVYTSSLLTRRWVSQVVIPTGFWSKKIHIPLHAGKVVCQFVKHDFNDYAMVISDQRTDSRHFYYISTTTARPDWAKSYELILLQDPLDSQIGLSILYVADLVLQSLKMHTHPLGTYSTTSLSTKIDFHLAQALLSYTEYEDSSSYLIVSSDVADLGLAGTDAYVPPPYAAELLSVFQAKDFQPLLYDHDHWGPIVSFLKTVSTPSAAKAAETLKHLIDQQIYLHWNKYRAERVKGILDVLFDSFCRAQWEALWSDLRPSELIAAVAEVEKISKSLKRKDQERLRDSAIKSAKADLSALVHKFISPEHIQVIILRQASEEESLHKLATRLTHLRNVAKKERLIPRTADVAALNRRVMEQLYQCQKSPLCQFIFDLFAEEWRQLQGLADTEQAKLSQGLKLLQAMGSSQSIDHILYAGAMPDKTEETKDSEAPLARAEEEKKIPPPLPIRHQYIIEFYKMLVAKGIRIDLSQLTHGEEQLYCLNTYGTLREQNPKDQMAQILILRKLCLQAWLEHYYITADRDAWLRGLSPRALAELIHFIQPLKKYAGPYADLRSHCPKMPMIQERQVLLIEKSAHLLSLILEGDPGYKAACSAQVEAWAKVQRPQKILQQFERSAFAGYFYFRDNGDEYSIIPREGRDWFSAFLSLTAPEGTTVTDAGVSAYHALCDDLKQVLDLFRLSIIWSYQIHDTLAQTLAFLVKTHYLDYDLPIPHCLGLDLDGHVELDVDERIAHPILAEEDESKNLIKILVSVNRILSMHPSKELELFIQDLRTQLKRINWSCLEDASTLSPEQRPRLTSAEKGLIAEFFCTERFCIKPAPDIRRLLDSAALRTTPLAGAGAGAGAGSSNSTLLPTRGDTDHHVHRLIELNMGYLLEEIAALRILEDALAEYRRSKEAMISSSIINHFIACIPLNRWYHRLYSVLSTSYGLATMLEEHEMKSSMQDMIVFTKTRIWNLIERLQKYQNRLRTAPEEAFLSPALQNAATELSIIVRFCDAVSSVVKLKSIQSRFSRYNGKEIEALVRRCAVAAGMLAATPASGPWYSRFICQNKNISTKENHDLEA